MLKNLVLVAGTVVFAVGCAETSEDAATEAPEVTVCDGGARSSGCCGNA